MRLILTSRTQNDNAWILKIDLACALPTFSSLDDKDKRGGVVGEQQTPPILKITSLTNHCTLSSLEPDTHTYGAHKAVHTSVVLSFVRSNCTAAHSSGRHCTDDGKLLRENLPGGLTATEHRDWETELEKGQ